MKKITSRNNTMSLEPSQNSALSHPPGELAFRWFDFAHATKAQMAEILHIYEYVFQHDIELVFDASLDSDFTAPLTYYSADVRGAYGVIVRKASDNDEETIVGTVGIRQVHIPKHCYSGEGSACLPPPPPPPSSDDQPSSSSLVCELKRMFLLPCARGKGLSKLMLDEVLRKARELGYQAMVLDTRKRLVAANKLYETVGEFVEFSDYNGNPRPDRFMIRRL